MVDRVELDPFDQGEQMRELHDDHAVRLHDLGEARDKVVDVRDVGEDVGSGDDVGLSPLAHHRTLSEEPRDGGHSISSGHLRTRLCRVNPEDGYPTFHEMPQ